MHRRVPRSPVRSTRDVATGDSVVARLRYQVPPMGEPERLPRAVLPCRSQLGASAGAPACLPQTKGHRRRRGVSPERRQAHTTADAELNRVTTSPVRRSPTHGLPVHEEAFLHVRIEESGGQKGPGRWRRARRDVPCDRRRKRRREAHVVRPVRDRTRGEREMQNTQVHKREQEPGIPRRQARQAARRDHTRRAGHRRSTPRRRTKARRARRRNGRHRNGTGKQTTENLKKHTASCRQQDTEHATSNETQRTC